MRNELKSRLLQQFHCVDDFNSFSIAWSAAKDNLLGVYGREIPRALNGSLFRVFGFIAGGQL